MTAATAATAATARAVVTLMSRSATTGLLPPRDHPGAGQKPDRAGYRPRVTAGWDCRDHRAPAPEEGEVVDADAAGHGSHLLGEARQASDKPSDYAPKPLRPAPDPARHCIWPDVRVPDVLLPWRTKSAGMACKRSAVRARLAPPGQPYNSNNLKRDFERLVALPGAALEPSQPPLTTSSTLQT